MLKIGSKDISINDIDMSEIKSDFTAIEIDEMTALYTSRKKN